MVSKEKSKNLLLCSCLSFSDCVRGSTIIRLMEKEINKRNNYIRQIQMYCIQMQYMQLYVAGILTYIAELAVNDHQSRFVMIVDGRLFSALCLVL